MRFPAGDDIDQNAEISEKIGKYRVSFFLWWDWWLILGMCFFEISGKFITMDFPRPPTDWNCRKKAGKS
jgi:hypothetical protein